MVKVATVDSVVELEMIQELFEENGIAVKVQHRETGGFLTLYAGITSYGIDLYVPEHQAEQAAEIYSVYFANKETPELIE